MYNSLFDKYTILKEQMFGNRFVYNQYPLMILEKLEIMAEKDQKRGCSC